MSEGLFRDSNETGEPMPTNNLPVDIYKLNANVIVSIDHLFPFLPDAGVCFVFSQHFKV